MALSAWILNEHSEHRLRTACFNLWCACGRKITWSETVDKLLLECVCRVEYLERKTTECDAAAALLDCRQNLLPRNFRSFEWAMVAIDQLVAAKAANVVMPRTICPLARLLHDCFAHISDACEQAGIYEALKARVLRMPEIVGSLCKGVAFLGEVAALVPELPHEKYDREESRLAALLDAVKRNGYTAAVSSSIVIAQTDTLRPFCSAIVLPFSSDLGVQKWFLSQFLQHARPTAQLSLVDMSGVHVSDMSDVTALMVMMQKLLVGAAVTAVDTFVRISSGVVGRANWAPCICMRSCRMPHAKPACRMQTKFLIKITQFCCILVYIMLITCRDWLESSWAQSSL